MADLYLSICLMILLCGLALAAGAWVAGRASYIQLLGCELLVGVLMLAFMVFLWDRPLLVRLLPFSSTIVLGNWLPCIACFFVGVCAQTKSIHWSRRLGLTFVTCGLSVFSLVRPVLGEPPRCFSLQPGKAMQFQTTDETCSAASAANLLRLHGIKTSEYEMACLCLTRTGTHWLGVYRGIKLKLADTPWDVVVEEFDVEGLLHEVLQRSSGKSAMFFTSPAVLSLSFVDRPGSQSVATGFSDATGHSVVLLETSTDGCMNVFDPSPEYGFESWPQQFTAGISRAVSLRIVPRNANCPPALDLHAQLRSEYKEQTFVLR